MTNGDIVKMVQAKLSTTVVIRTIEAFDAVKFDLSPTALVELTNADVEDRIIELAKLLQRYRVAGPQPAKGR